MRRRWAYTFGACLMIAASLAFASHVLAGQAAGMLLRNLGAAVMNITLSLYIMDHIRRTDLARSEPLRLSLSTFSWMTGPALGVWLYVHFGPWGPQLAAIAAAAALLLAVLVPEALRQCERAAAGQSREVQRARQSPPLPGAAAPAGWPGPSPSAAPASGAPSSSMGRCCWWRRGWARRVGGLMISASQAVLLTAWVSGRFAQALWREGGDRRGLRASARWPRSRRGLPERPSPYVAMGCLLMGSVAASALDGVGGIPFLRAVRHHERQQMAAVYRTYIDFSELIPAFVFAFALLWLPIGMVFVILSLGLAVIGWISWRYLPKSL